MSSTLFRKSVTLACCAAVAGAVIAEDIATGSTGSAFTYQGRLVQNGDPVTGPVTLEFALFDDEAATNQIESTITFPGFDDFQGGGLFTVDLDFGHDAFNGDARWLQISVDGNNLSPLQPLRPAPYAIRALNGDDIWNLVGNVAYYTGGNVGIGTDDPAARLHVQRASSGSIPQLRVESTTTNGFARLRMKTEGHDPHWDIAAGGSTNFMDFFRSDTGTIMRLRGDTQRVGIGSLNPDRKLDVNGDIAADTFHARANLGSTNAPESGTVYGDNIIYAWAHVRGDGVIMDSYGISHVQKFGTGFYDVHYNRAYDNALIATVTGRSSNDMVFTTAVAGTQVATVRTQEPGNIGGQFVIQNADRDFYIILTGRAQN